MKNCTRCKYAKWDRTKSGGLHPSGDGRCTYKVKIPALPTSMYWLGGAPSPSGGQINRREENDVHCAYYGEE